MRTVVPGPETWSLSGPCARLISEAIVMNACSTFVAFLALVSKKGICSWSANSCKRGEIEVHYITATLLMQQWYSSNHHVVV